MKNEGGFGSDHRMLSSVFAHEKSTSFLLVYGSSVPPSSLKIDTELIGLYVHPSVPLDAEVLRARLIINQPSGTSQIRLLCTGLSRMTGVLCINKNDPISVRRPVNYANVPSYVLDRDLAVIRPSGRPIVIPWFRPHERACASSLYTAYQSSPPPPTGSGR